MNLKICYDSHSKPKHCLVTIPPRRDAVISQNAKSEHYHYWLHLKLESVDGKQEQNCQESTRLKLILLLLFILLLFY